MRCEHCNKEYSSNVLPLHQQRCPQVKKENDPGDGEFKCDTCDKVYKSEAALLKHVEDKHPELKQG